LVTVRHDLTWHSVLSEFHPYSIALGNRQGSVPLCRGCKLKLAREQPRFKIRVVYNPPDSGPYLGMQVDYLCLKKFERLH
jgi:hypothetical protein